jgi:hypothetical protein
LTRQRILQGLALSAGILLGVGCNKTDNSNLNYRMALNHYYAQHPSCLWTEPKKFPVQAATSDDAKTEGYDALTDAGLLARSTAEKKVFIVASKQVNNYDLSGNGRTAWTPDPSQPGYGNFCYGRRDVTSIDSSVPANSPSTGEKTVRVNYHYNIGGVPAWAESQEMKTAFPALNTVLSGSQADQATLVMNGNAWEVAEK